MPSQSSSPQKQQLQPPPCVLMLYSSNDLRVHDNYALSLAARRAKQLQSPLVCAYCFDVRTLAQPSLVGGFFRAGPLRVKFLIECVAELRSNLQKCGTKLIVRVGIPEEQISTLCHQLNVVQVFSHTAYAPHEANVQTALRRAVESCDRGVAFTTVWGTTFIHIDDLVTPIAEIKESFRCFFDVFRSCRIRPTAPYNCQDGRIRKLNAASGSVMDDITADGVVDDGALPTLESLGYSKDFLLASCTAEAPLFAHVGGEAAAFDRIESWMETDGVMNELHKLHKTRAHNERRDQTGKFASQLSPWIAHGCLSPRALWEILRRYSYERMGRRVTEAQVNEVLLRLARRDFWHFMSLRYGRALFFPYGPRPGGTEQIPDFRNDAKIVRRWCDALTGIPFADAAMKELSHTGYASYQGRQALAWLLVKGLGQDWRIGAEWFERCLLDYDPHVTWGSFAYFSGLITDPHGDGVRSVHYLAHRHDQSAIYVRSWLPQLTRIPDVYIHRPHVLTQKMQRMHNVHLGKNYPFPVKLWPGAQHQRGLQLPSYYDDNGASTTAAALRGDMRRKLTGVGEAMVFGTQLLQPAMLPFTRESRQRQQQQLVTVASRRAKSSLAAAAHRALV